MISFSEAQHLVLGQASSFGKEKLLLDDAFGRVIAEPVMADRDYPPFNRAAMDGYAINYSDWQNGSRSFEIRETIYAGTTEAFSIQPGECYKIMTGASVPASADTIIRKEDVVEEDNRISCSVQTVDPFQHIAKRGEDLRSNQLVCSGPVLCTTAVIGMLASLGYHELTVEALPRVIIITTGNEVVSINAPVSPVQIRNSNRHTLKALLKSWNIIPVSCIHVKDTLGEIETAFKNAQMSDIIITCGGVSAGEADYIPEALANVGATRIFHKVSIRPGKPIWFGKFERGPTVFALPGNPFSSMVTFKLFVELFLSHSFGLGKPCQLELPLKGSRLKKSMLDEFFPVKIIGTPSGVEMISFNGSGDVVASMGAQAFARHPAGILEIPHGGILDCYPIS